MYEGKDIIDDVSIRTVHIIDRSGEKLDAVIIEFNNAENEWSTWKPKKNHALKVIHQGFSSGEVYIQSIQQLNGYIKLICLPIKESQKEKYTKSWENISFMELLQEISSRQGLNLKTYNVKNHMYSYITQVSESDFMFLNTRCVLEGYVMKVSDKSLIIFDERHMERQQPITIYATDVIGEYTYKNGAIKTYGMAKIGEYIFTSSEDEGPLLEVNVQADSIGEAERFAKNTLRAINKYKHTVHIPIKFNPGIAAGCTVKLEGFGIADNIYYVQEVTHQINNDVSVLSIRSILGW